MAAGAQRTGVVVAVLVVGGEAGHPVDVLLVGPGRVDQLRTLTELRVAVEPLATAGGARHATADERERLSTLATRMRQLGEAGELEAFLAADVEFHALLLQACLNEMFTALTDVIAEVLAGRPPRVTTSLHLEDPGHHAGPSACPRNTTTRGTDQPHRPPP
ncbi:FadR/GntR family transcriptional regulator [Micromonospora sp. NPDC048830]|uniref:FadR/GntR family transcriptional regulator n=1 Tax=Micromonospora sp. NPDC048830 TaxID=3364257 RepID=UPI00371056E6